MNNVFWLHTYCIWGKKDSLGEWSCLFRSRDPACFPVLYHAANSVKNSLLSSEILCDTKFTSKKTKALCNQKETTVFPGCSGSCCIMTADKIFTLYSSNYLQIHSYWKQISALRLLVLSYWHIHCKLLWK